MTFDEIVIETELYFDERGRGKHTGYKQFKRWEYWTRRSLGPQGKIIQSRKARSETALFRKEQPVTKSMSSNWTEMGPTMATNTSTWSSHLGRVSSIGLDVNDADHFIVGSPSGGVWKTLDEGATWTPIFDDETIINVYALAISHDNDLHYYAGTSGLGMMRSIDGGSTWTTTSGIPSGDLINRIIIDPDDADILLAVNQYGDVYRSSDTGDTWTNVLSTSHSMYDLEFKPGNSDIIYASGTGSVYKSTDNGNNFSVITGGPWNTQPMMMAVTEDDPDYLYILKSQDGGFGALYLSTDEGVTFTTQSDNSSGTNNIMGYSMNNTGGQAPRDMDVVVNPVDKTEVHVAGIMTFKSSNSGSTWSQTTHWVISNPLPFIHADCDLMFYQNDNIYFGTDGGIFISTDGGTTFDDKTTGLGIRQFYRIGVSETDIDRVSGGSQDNGTGTVENSSWTDWVGADGMETFIDKSNEDIIYATIQYGNLYKTTNGGNSLASINNSPGSGDWVTPLEEDPNTANTLYQGKKELYKSSNGGNTWTTISNFSPTSGGANLVEVTVAPSNSDVIYAAFKQDIYKTTDGGTTWTDVSPSISFTNVNYINVHPTDEDMALIVLSGTAQKVMETTDQGSTWTNITGSLPAVGAECAIYEGSSTDGIYVSMNPGIYYKSNTQTTWTTYDMALPNVRVAELEIRNNFIYAASYGRGLWKNDLFSNVNCAVTAITDDGFFDCSNTSGEYTRLLSVTYEGAPNTGTLDVLGQSFAITGSPQQVAISPMPLDGAAVDVTASFSDNSSCSLTEVALFTNPSTCPCNLTAANVMAETCDSNNTPGTSDDTHTFSLNPVGDNLGSTYSVSGDVTVSNVAYGSPFIFDNGGSGYPIAAGDLIIDITDDNDTSCALTQVVVTAPSTCTDNFTCSTAENIPGPGIYPAIGPYQGNGGSQAGQNANWFKYVPAVDGLLTVNSCEMGVDTRLYLHNGTCAALNQLDSSDDDCLTGNGNGNTEASEIVDFCVTGGVTYYIEWDDKWSASGFDFEVAFETDTFYVDNDMDGYGDPNGVIYACSQPSGHVTDNTDCDDNDVSNYPGNTEVCDGVDNNCDGIIDEGCSGNDPCDGANLVINTISQDAYHAEINITSDAIVNQTNPVSFHAGTDINLEYPFEVALGTEFEAIIEPCDPPPGAPGHIDELEAYLVQGLKGGSKISLSLIDETGEVREAKSGGEAAIQSAIQILKYHINDNWVLKYSFIAQ